MPFTFAPAGGIDTGGTGNLVSVACKGPCGTIAPNPMDVAVVADRTGSMSGDDKTAMVTGIKEMLKVMEPTQQYVALGTIGRSSPTTASQTGTCNDSSKGITYPSSSLTAGRWLPVSFSNNYRSGANTNNNSTLVKGVDCLDDRSSSTGTSLAAPMKAAARYLLGNDGNNLSALPARQDPARKVLIFETDGEPNEEAPTGGTASLGDANEAPWRRTRRRPGSWSSRSPTTSTRASRAAGATPLRHPTPPSTSTGRRRSSRSHRPMLARPSTASSG